MEDQAIVALFFARDEVALRETAAKYGTRCLAIAQNILRSVPDAEECVNDAYLAAWQSIPPARPSALGAFLGRIVRNLALDRWRAARAAKRGGEGLDLLLSELDEAIPAPGSVDAALEGARLTAAINAWLRTLKADDCALFVRRYWHGESVLDLASDSGRSANTVSKQLSRLRQRLRIHLEQEGFSL